MKAIFATMLSCYVFVFWLGMPLAERIFPVGGGFLATYSSNIR